MTQVRFQADADLKQAIVTGTIRREPNIDFESAYAAGLDSGATAGATVVIACTCP